MLSALWRCRLEYLNLSCSAVWLLLWSAGFWEGKIPHFSFDQTNLEYDFFIATFFTLARSLRSLFTFQVLLPLTPSDQPKLSIFLTRIFSRYRFSLLGFMLQISFLRVSPSWSGLLSGRPSSLNALVCSHRLWALWVPGWQEKTPI